jgi:hypothetical protein
MGKKTEKFLNFLNIHKYKLFSFVLVGTGFLFFKSIAGAESEFVSVADKTETGVSPSPSSCKKWSITKFLIEFSGLRKCLDPNRSRVEKAIYCSRVCCMIFGFTTGAPPELPK